MNIISLGIGSPASIATFILVGLSPNAVAVVDLGRTELVATYAPSSLLVAHAPAVSLPDFLAGLDLAFYLRQNETSGATASDSSGHGRDFTISATGVTMGVAGGLRDGSTAFSYANASGGNLSRVHEAWMDDLSSAFTFIALIKSTAIGGIRPIVGFTGSSPIGFRLASPSGAKVLQLSLVRGGSTDTVSSPVSSIYTDGAYLLVIGTWNAATSLVTFDLNGTEIKAETVAGSGPLDTNTNAMYVGGYAPTIYFSGSLDEIAGLSRVLTSAERVEVYARWQHRERTILVGTVS